MIADIEASSLRDETQQAQQGLHKQEEDYWLESGSAAAALVAPAGSGDAADPADAEPGGAAQGDL